MPERINKLQPDRTLQLRGFNTFAATTSITNASPTGFTVGGTFRDPADFAVALLYDADNYFEHPSIKYLPDFNFAGLTLSFDLNYTDGVQPIDSPKFNWIDWATLDCIRSDVNSTTAQVNLWDHATLVGSSFPAATATCNILAGSTGIRQYDRVTLWFQNLAFDYTVAPGASSVQYYFNPAGAGTVHTITIAGVTYSYTEVDAIGSDGQSIGNSGADVVTNLILAIGANPYVIASEGSATNAVLLTVQLAKAGVSFPVSASDGNNAVTMFLTTAALVAAQIVSEINGTNWITANTTHALLASNSGAAITLTAARYGTVSISGNTVTSISGASFPGIVAGSLIRLGGASYTVASVQSPTVLTLTSPAPSSTGISVNGSAVAWVSGPTFAGISAGSTLFIDGGSYTVASVQSAVSLTLTTVAPNGASVLASLYIAPRGGRDGNLIQLYATWATSTLTFDQPHIQLAGGSSSVTWNVSLNFTALGIDQVRQLWLTFAPSLVTGAYTSTEWQAVFSNWQLSGPVTTQALNVAGPGSVRIEENDSACVYTGTWSVDTAFYSQYFANFTPAGNTAASSVSVTYNCQYTHDVYIGTSLYVDRGTVQIRLDNNSVAAALNCYLNTGSPVIARRQAFTGIPAGRHTVTITVPAGTLFYFDFLEAAVVSDVPDALAPRNSISPALDFDTDHSYKLPPARIMWMMDQLGYAGPMNEYLGVFWWNERVLAAGTGSISTAQIAFSGSFAAGDTVFVTLNGTVLGKSVFATDTLASIAYHFAAYINSTFVGAWASAGQTVLTITSRSPASAYNLAVSVSCSSNAGQVTIAQAPVAGAYGTYQVNDAANPPMNLATRNWHSDFYAQCASRGRAVVTSLSMELVNPPDGYVARFPDSTVVSTATGFGSLVSNQCAIGGSKMLAYQKSVYRNIAQLQAAAGLTPSLQYGEFLWWYFPLAQNVPVGFASYTQPISIGTQLPHGLSTGQTVTIYGVLGNTAANGTFTIAVTDSTHFTLNGTSGNGDYTSGGVFSGGGMAYYDAETMAAAQTALGRPLHFFQWSQDDPSVNGGADALFLRNRLRDHVAALVADIRSACPAAKCEVLWPYDVNYPTPIPVGAPTLGGQLNYAVNLPVEWQLQTTSGFDTMKVEALAFASSLRNLDLAREAVNLFPGFGWPVSALRYLVPVFGSATPWPRELSLAIGAGISINNLWAFDHVCLFNLPVPEPSLERRSLVKVA
jgi:hypothetical protein